MFTVGKKETHQGAEGVCLSPVYRIRLTPMHSNLPLVPGTTGGA